VTVFAHSGGALFLFGTGSDGDLHYAQVRFSGIFMDFWGVFVLVVFLAYFCFFFCAFSTLLAFFLVFFGVHVLPFECHFWVFAVFFADFWSGIGVWMIDKCMFYIISSFSCFGGVFYMKFRRELHELVA
jgi:hypothetical protein